MSDDSIDPTSTLSQSKYEMVVGLEVHSQLLTKTKMFCRCENRFGAEPNTLTCPVCLGYPGVLPVMNERALRLGIRLGLALGCSIHRKSFFDRKHYFYPDLPKGYQISQFDHPLLTGGSISLLGPDAGKTIRIHRIHMEEDAGKNLHAGLADSSHVDLNRAGVPLLEIVSEPDIRSPSEAVSYLKQLRLILRASGVSDGNMEEGSFRCDANVSLRLRGESRFGVKVEVKNMNSFRFVQKALVYEFSRQSELLDRGERIRSETRLFDTGNGRTLPMRSKEEALDYRFFPEPDIPMVFFPEEWIDEERKNLPELPEEKAIRLARELGIDPSDARTLVFEEELVVFFEEALSHFEPMSKVRGFELSKGRSRLLHFVLSEVLREWNRRGDAALSSGGAAQGLAHILAGVMDESLSLNQAKEVYLLSLDLEQHPSEVIKEKGFAQVSGEGALSAWIDEMISENPKEVSDFCSGKDRLLGFLVGQVMKKSAGKANPQKVNELIRQKLMPSST